MNNYLKPNWPAPKNIIAYTTTRFHANGKSEPPYDNFNLATHVGDNLSHVLQNRELLKQDLQLPNNPCWLNQQHTINAIKIDNFVNWHEPVADASYTLENNVVCTVLTADCLPILVTDKHGSFVAAIHAGWKGLAAGIIEATIKSLSLEKQTLMAWLGPAIGPLAFVVGEEVMQQFISFDQSAERAFTFLTKENKWLCNIYDLAKQRLHKLGINEIYGGNYCTFTDAEKFYSFRRDNGITGRMATLIYKI